MAPLLLVRSAAVAVAAGSAGATTSKVTLEALVSHPPRSEHPVHRSRSSAQLPHARLLPSLCLRRHAQFCGLSRRSHARAFSFSTTSLQHSQGGVQEEGSISDQIRALMRGSAQPVALVTTFLPRSAAEQDKGGGARRIHGATLSSFSSISLEPNLVTFSIKTPSKLADALRHHWQARTRAADTCPEERASQEVDFVINVLAQTQASLAAAYATPGTSPLSHGGTSCTRKQEQEQEEEEHPLQQAGLIEVRGKGTLPVVQGAVGAFGCQVVNTIDLSQYAQPAELQQSGDSKSILYIARVIHVHHSPTSATHAQPLLYHRHKFVSTCQTPLLT